MDDLIVFSLTEEYADFSGGNVSLVDGVGYDVGEALDTGDGRIVLAPHPRRDEEGEFSKDEEERAWRDGQIVDALDKYEALERVDAGDGDEPPSYDGVSVAPQEGPSKGELETRARELGVTDWSGLEKDELATAISEKEAELAVEAEQAAAEKAASDQAAAEATETEEGGEWVDDSSAEGSED